MYQEIINHFYPTDTELRHLLLLHSRQVADKALSIVHRPPELGADITFVEEGAMLHDIGIFLTSAPSIHCHGSQPYICHGILGANLLRSMGHETFARVCERHTGAGISLQDILSQQLPLPHQDFLPETIEEQIICYADKFFSKSHPEHTKTVEQAVNSLKKFGSDGTARFLRWAERFE